MEDSLKRGRELRESKGIINRVSWNGMRCTFWIVILLHELSLLRCYTHLEEIEEIMYKNIITMILYKNIEKYWKIKNPDRNRIDDMGEII